MKNTVPLTGAISYGTATNFHVGNDPFGEYFNGDIAEVLVYDHALTDDEQFQLGTYLNDKYQLPGVVVPSAPTSVTATAISSSRVNVTWQPGTTTSPIMHYVVERKGGSGSFIKIAELPDSLSYLDSGVTSGTSYTYRISARSYAGTSPGTESNAVTVTAGGLGFSEEGLQLWLRADAGVDTDSTGKVTRWKDLSGNGRDVTQATASSQPTYQASSINNLPAVRFSFDGSGKFLTGSANAALKPANITIFAVHKMNGGGNSPSIVAMPHHDGAWSAPSPSWALYAGYGNPSNRQPFAALAVGSTSYQNFTSTTTALNATTMVFASYDGTASRVYLNGVLKNTVTVSGALAYGTTNSFYVGSNPGNEFMDGDIAEIMVFDRALGPIERQAVSNYLNQRYAYNTTATPPATPTNLTADAVSGTQVALAWDAVSAAEEVSYTLERKTGAGAYAPIAQLSGVSGYFDGTVQPGTGYTYRLKASSLGGASSYSNEASVTTPATGIPVPLAGMRLWLKADTVSAGAVSVWPDFSGHHNDASQTNAALQPLKVSAAINGRPAVRFDGSNDYLAFGDLMAGATAGEVFIVLKNSTASPTRNNNLWYFTRGSYHPLQDKTTLETFATSEDIYGPEPVQALDQPHLYNVSGQSGSWTSWINGSVYLSRATNTVPAFYTAPQLGWAGYGGDIAEVIIYDHALTTAEREAVGGYLNRRFAFIAAAPATPGALAASAVSGTQVSLTWSGVQNGSGTIYTLERKTGSGGYAVLAETEALSYFDATAVADTAYTYRVKARNLAGESGYSNEAGATTPASGTALPVSGMRLWLKADTLVSEGRVGIWFDQSGSHHDATQQNSILQPLLVANAINGRPAVRFDGSNDYLALGDFMNGATAGEVFVVLKNSTAEPTRNNGLWFITGGSYHPLQDKTTLENFATNTDTYGPEPVQALDQPHLYNVSGQNGSWASWINGSLYLSKSTNTVPTFSAAAQLGWNGYGGDIAEIIIYDHALTAAEREVVGRYLNQRHAFVPAVPANPTNLTAQALASTQVNLSWSAALTGKGTIFTVERRTGTDPFAPVADVADSLSFIDATAASDMTYTYRVTARNLAGASGYSNEASATTATSGGVAMPLTGIRLWLKADAIASTGPVGTWLDQSGNRNHGTQLNAVFQPQVIANALNGRPVVRFDGANDVFNLSPAMMAGATEGEVLVVLKTAAAALPGDNGLWYFGGTDGNYYPLTDGTTIETFGTTVAYTGPVPAQPLNQYHLYNVSAQAGAWMSSLNGVPYVVQSTNTVTFGASAPTLGRGHNFFSGDIAEIIVYDHALSATERETAERYFNQRYQLTPSPFTAVNDFAYDSDGDGLSNAYELAHGLNPYNRDSDGDGIPDGWEIAHGLNPLDPSDALQLGANGLTNLENYYNDTGTTGASVKLKVFQPAQR
ncbi:MAG TPA: LamG-like jellyroll fold domain-containing protein [Lacunisphaera sp.]